MAQATSSLYSGSTIAAPPLVKTKAIQKNTLGRFYSNFAKFATSLFLFFVLYIALFGDVAIPTMCCFHIDQPTDHSLLGKGWFDMAPAEMDDNLKADLKLGTPI
jgi:hypothetical protein